VDMVKAQKAVKQEAKKAKAGCEGCGATAVRRG